MNASIIRKTVLAFGLVAAVAVCAVGAAQADGWHRGWRGGDRWRGDGWGHRDWRWERAREWRAGIYGPPPVVYGPPPQAVYVPPPAVMMPPPAGINFVLPLNFR
ncbi:MAG: hypothetical protein M0006_01515 [Magnetospirillum sp.]|nr:hypothetical protein [Magnetospirillum sp.]